MQHTVTCHPVCYIELPVMWEVAAALSWIALCH